MKKITKTFLASGLLCSLITLGGTAIALAETGTQNSQNLGYAPDITVEWGEYSAENIPQAVKDTPYQLFTASAKTIYGDEVAVRTRVYLHYLEENKTLVTLKNNTITPSHYGIYTVEYRATDEFGNLAIFTYDFACEDTEKLSISLSAHETRATVGVETPIADYAYANEIGFVTTKVTATLEGGEVVYDVTDKTCFTPLYVGEYTIEYVCTDYNVTVENSYQLTVEDNLNPVFLSVCDMPKYFIVGQEYTLPSVESYVFVNGKPYAATPIITVSAGKGRAKELNGYTFIPDEAGELTIVYTVVSNENKQSQVYTARAIDVGEVGTTFDLSKYFYSETAFIRSTPDCVTLTTETDGTVVEFINALSSRAFSIDFLGSATNFEALNIYLTDSKDESARLKITYGNPGTEDVYLSVNDGKKYGVKLSSFLQTIAYDEEANTVTMNVSEPIACPKSFKGFESGKIRFALELVGVKGESQIDVYSINNQLFAQAAGDGFKPQVWFEDVKKSVYQLNELVSISAIKVGDVLDSHITAGFRVIGPDEEFVISEEGVLLDGDFDYTKPYTFCARQYGEYRVIIFAEDSSGNRQNYAYTFAVEDIVGPTVSINSKMPKNLVVNSSFTVSDITISDEKSTTFTTRVILVATRGDYKDLQIGTTYTFTAEGTYNLYYIVADESGNTTIICHTFTVV